MTSSRYIPVKNTLVCSAVAFCVCELVLFYIVLCRVRTVRTVANWRRNAWRPLNGGGCRERETRTFDSTSMCYMNVYPIDEVPPLTRSEVFCSGQDNTWCSWYRANWSLDRNSAVVSEGLSLRLTRVLLDTPKGAVTVQSVHLLQQHHVLWTDCSTHRPARAPLWTQSPVPAPNRTSLSRSSSPQPSPVNVSIRARCQKERSSAALLKAKRLRPSSPSAGKNTFFFMILAVLAVCVVAAGLLNLFAMRTLHFSQQCLWTQLSYGLWRRVDW